MSLKRDYKWWRDYRKRHPEVNRKACSRWYKKNNLERDKQIKEYHKTHPEVKYNSRLKSLKNMAVKFNINAYQFGILRSNWSKLVRHRDNNICQICGGIANISHHILYKSLYPELSLNINNGISLCKKCHLEVHFGHV